MTSSLLRSSKLLSLSVKATTGAAVLSLRSLISDKTKNQLTHEFLTTQAKKLTQELGKMKGALQKAGQLFSVYGEHFLPAEVNAVLKTLQKDTPPVTWDVMRMVATRALGSERFNQIIWDENPIGTASIGQVYKVRIPGSDVEWCMKLQYPGVDKSIDSDLRILRSVFGVLRFIPKDMNLDGLFDEIRTMLHREVDYLKEAEATENFRQWLAADSRFIVPTVHREYTSRRAILTTFEKGYDIDSPEVAALSQERRNRLGEAILELFFKEFFEFRTVQTDPHFGNYRIRIGADGQDQWVLLDFGAVRKFSKEFVQQYRQMGSAVVYESDPQKMYDNLRALGILNDNETMESIQGFYEIARLISEPFLDDQPYLWGTSGLAHRVAEKVKTVLFDHGVRRPREELVFLDRKTGGVFTILQKLDVAIMGRPILSKYLGAPHTANTP